MNEPRVIRIEYKPATDSFSYSFTIPPALKICRISRYLAHQSYISLVANTPFPVYFNPEIDFVYCKSPLDKFGMCYTEDLLPGRRTVPFVEDGTKVGCIRFLVFDQGYWLHRSKQNYHHPLQELKDFKNIEEIFIAMCSLEQHLEIRRRLFQFAPPRPFARSRDVDWIYSKEVAQELRAPSSIVPGFRQHRVESPLDQTTEAELKRSLSLEFIPPNPNIPHQFMSAGRHTFDEYWSKRGLPKVNFAREVLSHPAPLYIVDPDIHLDSTNPQAPLPLRPNCNPV